MKRRLIRLLSFLALLSVIALVVVGALGSSHLVSPARRSLQDYHLQILGKQAEHGIQILDFTAADGTPCLLVYPANHPGRAYKGRELRKRLARAGCRPAPWGQVRGTVVLLHGHTGRKEDNLPIAERFCAAGFRCLLPDLPGHGESPLDAGSFGFHEAARIESWLDECAGEVGFRPRPACLFGISQGGSVALLTAARSNDRWAAVTSVSSFRSLDEMLERAARQAVGPAAPLAATSSALGVWMRAGYLPSQVCPIEAAREISIPAMIVHGAQDQFIPPSDGQALFEAIPHSNKHLRLVPDGEHGNVLARGSHPLYAEICRFFIASIEA